MFCIFQLFRQEQGTEKVSRTEVLRRRLSKKENMLQGHEMLR